MASNIGLWGRLAVLVVISFFFAACDGDDGAAGAAGAPGAIEPVAAAKVESCATCHEDVGEGTHQSIYDKYVDASKLALTITNVASVADGAGTFTVTVDFSITDDGMPLLEGPGLASMDQKRFYAVQYDSVTGQYLNSTSLHQITDGSFTNVVAGAGAGDYVLTRTTRPYAVETPLAPYDGAQVYGYIARIPLLEHAGDPGAELPAGSHVHLYDDVSNTAMAFGTALAADANSYESMANVAGCVKCHGSPYMKHGYRNPIVAGLPDFSSCKSCHYDDRNGGHEDWQYMVDDPVNWANAGLPEATVETLYAYKAKLMNDVHMAHAMEFPYPQSMSNCATCHEGKLTQVLDNANFVPETCKSCHPVQGLEAWPAEIVAGDGLRGDYRQGHRAPPLEYLWASAPTDLAFHVPIIENPALDPTGDTCKQCHGAGIARPFNELHTGYDVNITDATGARYMDTYTVSIDSVSIVDPIGAPNILTIEYSASDPAILPEVLISFYGWDSRNFLIASHTRDANPACMSRGRPGCRFEYEIGDTNPLFPSFTEVAPGSWVLTADMAAFQAIETVDIPTLIANGDVRLAEVTLTPELEVTVGTEQVEVVLNAVGQTFDLVANALVADVDHFKGASATVDTDKCNVCHDSLASSFHSESGRGGGGIQVCKNCHNVTFTGSHVEMASRSIDNYVHAIHSFQAFDPGDTFEVFDPVLAARYNQHVHHTFPNFTIRNCEACHLDGTFDVPDQSKSMPSASSTSDTVATWYEMVSTGGNIPSSIASEVPAGRNIGTVPEMVTGPASRACGGCHRAEFINVDDAGGLASWNAHTEAFGTFVENDPTDDSVLFEVIDKIMSLFE
jgi:OmcA/MtrC family decaheme c-type cytochrome